MAGGITGSFAEFHGYTLKQPIGVVGLIVPWNGPFHVAACKLAPALAAGCSCVLKPAEQTPLSALVMEKILAEAGVPEAPMLDIMGHMSAETLRGYSYPRKAAKIEAMEAEEAQSARPTSSIQLTRVVRKKQPQLIEWAVSSAG